MILPIRRLSVICIALALPPAVRAAVIEVRPGNSIREAVRRAKSGDVVNVRAGLYKERVIIPGDGVTLISADGPGKARIDSQGKNMTLYLWRHNNVVVDGFECFNSLDNIVQVSQAKNCILRNLYVHDAGLGGDCIKVNGNTEDLLIENCVAHSPGKGPSRTDTVEECIDIIGSRRVTIRGCWLYYTGKEEHRNQLGYSKWDCFDIVWENNVFGPTHPKARGDAALGGGWSGGNKSGWNTVGVIYRNNLFVDCHFAALGIYGQKDVYVVNNTFVNSGRLGKNIIEIQGGGKAKHSENIHIYNNIFVDYDGRMPRMKGVLGKGGGGATWKNIVSGNNIYYNGGKAVPSSGLLNPHKEKGARLVDPRLLARALPRITTETTRASLLKLFGLAPGSPAINTARKMEDKRLQVTTDALGARRPQGQAADIGAREFAAAGGG